MSIGRKVSLFILCLILVLVMSLLFVNYETTVKEIDRKNIALIERNLDSVSQLIDKKIDVGKTELLNAAKAIEHSDRIEGDFLTSLIKGINSVNEGTDLFMMTEKAEYADLGTFAVMEKFFTRDWYQGAIKKNGVIHVCEPYFSSVLKEMVVTLSTGITFPSGTNAVVACDIPIGDIATICN